MKTLVLALCLFVFAGASQAEDVSAILSRMDQAAPNFHAMSANVEMTTYTKVLDDTTRQKGTLKMQRLKPNDVRAIIDFSGEADAQIIAFLGKIVRIYYPKLNAYQDYEVGKNSNVLNQFLLLGFGSSGKELAQSYSITAEGVENVAGHDTTKLLLVPNDANVKQRLSKIEVWMPNDAAYPVQQQFYEPSGNYRKVSYTNIVLNPPIKGTLEMKLPPGATKQSAQ